MKYFSIECVKEAYSLVSKETKDKFWGILAILYSIDNIVKPNISYNIDVVKLSSFLEDTFRLKDKKNYENSSSEYSAVLSSLWVEKISQNFLIGTPDIVPIIVWAYRRHGFDHNLTIQDLIAKFVNDFHLSKEIADELFSLKQSTFNIEFVDNLYDDIHLLKNIKGNEYDINKTTLKMGKDVAVANAGDLSRGPFFQPLYASLNTLECLTIYPFNVNDYYSAFQNGNKQHCLTSNNSYSLQQIYFGAPGTGKSHEIKKNVKNHRTFRITFHPDTDYSSFVGAYKPTSVEVPMLTTLGDKAIPMKDVDGNPLTENKIIYTYVKQAFLNAYIEAWKEQENETPKPVFLVIEEINRGNCAQIFGDIFQLLDRNDTGFSDYAIVPDTDLSRHVKKDLEKLVIADREKINAIYEECEADMVDKVLKGEVLLLPNNLYIWATMNTSDQSLFPIDSAFKRRWDWKYIKIANAHKNWQIKIGTEAFDWWQFVQAINYFVFDATQSEDKNLGYFFAKAKDDIISAETFVSKVIFYLYTDVFKDYGFSGDIFKGANDEEMTFQSFYTNDGKPCEAQIIRFIKNVIYSNALPDYLKASEPAEEPVTEEQETNNA